MFICSNAIACAWELKVIGAEERAFGAGAERQGPVRIAVPVIKEGKIDKY